MPIPKYNELYIPFLTAIEDGNVHTMKEVREKVAEMLSLGEEELSERLPSGNQTFDNRIGWAKTYLKKAGLVEVPKRAHFKITKEGKRLLDSGERITDKLLAEKYDTFAAFKGKKDAEGNMASEEQHDMAETPMETRFSGRSMLVSALQPEKANVSIAVRLSGRVMLLSCAHRKKARLAIPVVPWRSVTFSTVVSQSMTHPAI